VTLELRYSLFQLYRLYLVQSTLNVLIVPAVFGTIYFKILKFIKVFSLIKLRLLFNLLKSSNITNEINYIILQIGFLLFQLYQLYLVQSTFKYSTLSRFSVQ
jgi:hypothetical protein